MSTGLKPSVYWLLRGSYISPSSRLHGHRIHKYLQKRGWNSAILVNPSHWLTDIPLIPRDTIDIPLLRTGDIVVFQKLEGTLTVELIEFLSQLKVKTVFLDCDLPLKLREASQASWVVCSSQFLAQEYRHRGLTSVVYIPDAFECCSEPKEKPTKGRKLRCVWYGTGGIEKWESIEHIRTIMENAQLADWEMVTISSHENADIKWDLHTAWRHTSDCDVVLLPSSDDPWAKAKSSNRAIQAMALGLPVVAYPIPAYEEVIRNGWNGFLCREDKDWLGALSKLRDDRLRREMGVNAYRYAQEFFSLEKIGHIWEEFLSGLGHPRHTGNTLSIRAGVKVLQKRKLQSRAYSRMSWQIREKQTRLAIRYAMCAFKLWPFDRELYKAKLYSCLFSRVYKALLRRFTKQTRVFVQSNRE